MPELFLAKAAGGLLVPADQPTSDYIAGFKLDAGFKASVREYNNIRFHRLLMALFQHAYEVWEPVDLWYMGQQVKKNFDQLRRDLTVLAGYYDACVDFSGRVRLVAKSLRFDRMGKSMREKLYSDVIDVILTRILTHYSRADLENVLMQTLGFAR